MARQKKPACLKQGKSESKAQLQQRQQIEEMLSGDDELVYSVPQNLDSKGQIFYKFIVDELRHSNILTNIDIPLLEQTADCLSKMRECDILIEKMGLFYEELDRYGNKTLEHYYYDDNLDQFYWHDTELNKYRELPYISLKNGSRYVWAYETNGNRVAILIHKFKQLYNLE